MGRPMTAETCTPWCEPNRAGEPARLWARLPRRRTVPPWPHADHLPQPGRPRRRRRPGRGGRRRRLHRRVPDGARAPSPPGPRCRRRCAAGSSPRSAGWSRPTRRRSPPWSPARSASRTPRRWARCRRSSTPATSSSARAGGSTARRSRARCRTSSCSRSVCRSAWPPSSPPRTSRSPCRPGTSCRRCCAATRWCGSRPSRRPRSPNALAELFWHGGVPRDVLQVVHADGPTAFDGISAALDERPGRQDRLHRLDRRRAAHRRARRPAPAVGVPRARRQEPAGRHARTPTSTSRSRARCSAGSASAGQRCTSLGTVFVHSSVLRRVRAAASPPQSPPAPVGDPTQDVLYGPLINESYLTNFAKWLDMVQAHHTVHGSTGTGRITAANPREGLRR